MTNEQYKELINKNNQASGIKLKLEDSERLIKLLEENLNLNRDCIYLRSSVGDIYCLRNDQTNALLTLERNRVLCLEKEFAEL
jgi:hypothetical protein